MIKTKIVQCELYPVYMESDVDDDDAIDITLTAQQFSDFCYVNDQWERMQNLIRQKFEEASNE